MTMATNAKPGPQTQYIDTERTCLCFAQVLELQFQLEESQKNCQVLEITVSQNKISHQQLQTENSYLKAQLEEVEQKNARLKSLEVSSKGPDTEPASGGVLMGLTPIHQETQNIFDGDSWADAPSVEVGVRDFVKMKKVNAHPFLVIVICKMARRSVCKYVAVYLWT